MDDICQEQFMEMSYLNGGQEHGARGRGGMPVRGRGVPPAGAHRCGDTRTDTCSHNSCWVSECSTKTVLFIYPYINESMNMLSKV